jgi:hypothetical protein
MLIKREITNELLDMANQFPVVKITIPVNWEEQC